MRFASHQIFLDGDSDIAEKLEEIYPGYSFGECQQDSSIIRIHWLPEDYKLEKKTNWSVIVDGVTYRVGYYDRQGLLFSIEYQACSNELDLYIGSDYGRTLRVGLHYAVMLVTSAYCVGLHGVTVLCRDKAFILSAPSGTGKTTLSNLLQKYGDAVVVNGDFALLSFDESGQVIFEPTPFCGSSKIARNVRIPISRIIFLRQACNNDYMELGGREALKQLLSNTFIPQWDCIARENVQKNELEILRRLPVSMFGFVPDASAVEAFYNKVFCE